MTNSDSTSGFEPGDIVGGRYRLTSKLGEGGMGVVFKAEHIELKRVVALKVLLPIRTMDERPVRRFKQEARVAASIGHPGIVEVFDLGEDERRGETFIAMELLEGEELHERIARSRPLSIDFVTNIGIELADAVAAAHEHGIIHRDLKPRNVFLAREGRRSDVVKVLDFGLAKLIESSDSDASITRSGELFGTPLYMSPEQLRNARDIDGRADIYAIGVILYEALAGVPPFVAETLTELVLKVATTMPPPLSMYRPEVPQKLADVIERAMNKDLTLRYQSASALRDALEDCLGARPADPPSESRASSVEIGLEKTLQIGADQDDRSRERDGSSAALADEVSLDSLPPRQFDESVLRRRRTLGVAIGIILLVVVGGVGVTLLMSSNQHRQDDRADGQERSQTAAVGAVGASHPTTGDADPAGVDEATVVQPSDAGADVERARRVVRFITHPAGAQILRNGVRLCEAPCEADLQDMEAEISAQLNGHVQEDRWIRPPIPDVVELRLRRTSPPTKLGSSGTGTRPTSTKEPEPPPLLPR